MEVQPAGASLAGLPVILGGKQTFLEVVLLIKIIFLLSFLYEKIGHRPLSLL